MSERNQGPRLLGCAAGLLSVTLLSGCSAAGDLGTPADRPQSTADAYPKLADQVENAEKQPGDAGNEQAEMAATALEVLDSIPVADRTEWDGPFDRAAHFGDGWADLDGDGCNTRNETLESQLEQVHLLRDNCRVDTGVLEDPYTGETVSFQRGQGTSERVQIDHVVAVYNAWRTGAQDLSYEQRVAFANDPLNLQATQDWVNDEKMSSDASQWLPPDESYHCTYISRQIAVKATYQLWVTEAEDAAMREVLAGCL